MQWGIEGFGAHRDRNKLQAQNTFRDHVEHALSLGYGEITEADAQIDAAESGLENPCRLIFIPAEKNPKGKPRFYTAHGDPPQDAAIRSLLRVGSKGEICFGSGFKKRFHPENTWRYVVMQNLTDSSDHGEMTFFVTRDNDHDVETVDFPSANMFATDGEETTEVCLLPEVSDVAPKRLGACASGLLHRGGGESPRMADLRRLYLGRDYSERSA